MFSHSASETERGSLLTISECAKGIKDTRRSSHLAKDRQERDRWQERGLLLAIGQRLIASGCEVRETSQKTLEVADNRGEVVLVKAFGETYRQADPPYDPALYIHSSSSLPNLAVAVDYGLVAAKSIIWSSPKLILSVMRSWSDVSPALRQTVDELGKRLWRLEQHPGRLHCALLKVMSSVKADTRWETILESGVIPALAFIHILAYSGNKLESIHKVAETVRFEAYSKGIGTIENISEIDEYLMHSLKTD